jgi:hypothetical protein
VRRIGSKGRLDREIEEFAYFRAKSLFGLFKGPDGGHRGGRWWPLRAPSTVSIDVKPVAPVEDARGL